MKQGEIKVILQELYETTDGELFDCNDKATKHQNYLDLIKCIEENNLYDEVYDFINTTWDNKNKKS